MYRITNSAGFNQTAPEEQSILGLHCLFRPVCPNIKNNTISVKQYIACARVASETVYNTPLGEATMSFPFASLLNGGRLLRESMCSLNRSTFLPLIVDLFLEGHITSK